MENQAPSINLLDVLRGIGRHKLLILVFVILGFGAGMALVATSATIYTTEAEVLIENLASPFDRVQAGDSQLQALTIDDREILSQISVMRSRDLAVRVVAALNLQDRDEFDSLRGKTVGAVKDILIRWGFSDDPRLMTPQERALQRYFKQLNVYQVPLSNVVAVKYSANDPATAAEVANALANIYVTSTAEAKAEPTARAREWLGRQITDLRKKVSASDSQIESYRAQYGLLKGETSTLGSQELSELNTQITLAETARTEVEARAREINKILSSKGTVDASTDVLNSTNVQRLREQQAISARKVAELSATYMPNHPKMMAAQNDLTNINRQIRSEALKVVEGLNQQAKIAKAREDSLRARLEEMKSSTSTANLDDVKLQAMIRDSTADKALLESLLLRYVDANARQDISTQPGFARIIQVADAPTSPSFPKTGPMVLLLTLAGLALSLGLSFVLEIMNVASTLHQPVLASALPTPRAAPPPLGQPAPQAIIKPPAAIEPVDVSEPIKTPVLTVLPVGDTVSANQDLMRMSVLQDSYGLNNAVDQIANWAIELHNTSAMRLLAVASLGGGEASSSMVVVALARAFAAKRVRAVVVDLAAQGSSVELLFGLPQGPGLADLLAGKADFTKVIVRDPTSSAHLLRFGFEHSETSAILLGKKTEAVLGALRKIYDLVIIHLGEHATGAMSWPVDFEAALLLAPTKLLSNATALAQILSSGGEVVAQVARLEPWSANAVKLQASA
jgi:succinoglycan biosynthesis transport protein ExoP